MSYSAHEQYLLELVNAERAKVGAQPLAFNADLNESAEAHSEWMIATDTFSHTGSGGSNAGARMKSAGYNWSSSAENIAWASARSPAGYQDEVQLLHSGLMNSSGHRANILNNNYKEVGIGFETGQYSQWSDAAFVTQNFGRSGTSSFLTGVAFDDKDGDKFYDPGEGLGGLTVAITNRSTGEVKTTTTQEAGGYQLALAAGTYDVTFSGQGLAPSTQNVTMGSVNKKIDLVDPAMNVASPTPTPTPSPAPTTPEPPAPAPAPAVNTVNGTSGNNILYGTSAADQMQGLAGNDYLFGKSGDDRIDGGTGNDRLYGSSGNDVLAGGAGLDRFYFNTALSGSTNVDTITDFSVTDDSIYIENSYFTGLSAGTLKASALHVGSAAADSADRVIYNKTTGELMFDPDGSGSAPSVQFAAIAANLSLTASDFVVT